MNIVFGLVISIVSILGLSYFVGWMVEYKSIYSLNEPTDHLYRLFTGLKWFGLICLVCVLVFGLFFGIVILLEGLGL